MTFSKGCDIVDSTKQKVAALQDRLIEFYSYDGRRKDNSYAKSVLTKVSEEIKLIPAHPQKLFSLDYLERLTHLYFALLNEDYAWACNDVNTYLETFPIQERRIKDALVSLLEKFGF